MGIYLAEQTMLFFQSILLGGAFGLLYDALRITRIAIPTARWVVFIEDVFFFFTCAVSTFFFIMRTIDGQVRLFVLIGAALGMILYFHSLSLLVMGISQAIIGVIKAILRLIFRWILFPIWRLFYGIVRLIIRPFRFLGAAAKKTIQRCKLSLKVRHKVLYNQLRSKLAKIGNSGQPEKPEKRKRKFRTHAKKRREKKGRTQELNA